MALSIRLARIPDDLEPIRGLLRSYFADTLVASCFGDFECELATLPGDYAGPGGAILVAAGADDRPIGCVALRPFEGDVGEMKRLFVDAAGRGTGAGRRLVEAVVDLARRRGYRALRLDTLPTQTAAQGIYSSLGFVDIPAYRHNPVAGTRFLELQLADR